MCERSLRYEILLMTMVRRLCTAAVAEQNLSGNGREIVNRAGIYITCDEKETKASYRLHIPLQAYIKLGTQLRLAARHFGPSRSVEPNQTSSKFSSIRSVLVSNRNMKKRKRVFRCVSNLNLIRARLCTRYTLARQPPLLRDFPRRVNAREGSVK